MTTIAMMTIITTRDQQDLIYDDGVRLLVRNATCLTLIIIIIKPIIILLLFYITLADIPD